MLRYRKPKYRRLSFTEKFSSQIEHKIVKIVDGSEYMENVTYRIETSSVDQSLESLHSEVIYFSSLCGILDLKSISVTD